MTLSNQLTELHETTEGIEFIDFGCLHEFRLFKDGQVHAYSFGDCLELDKALHDCCSDAAGKDRNLTYYEAALLTAWMRKSSLACTKPIED